MIKVIYMSYVCNVSTKVPRIKVISQKVISDVYVLSAAVFNGIICHADCTLIITYERDFAQLVAIVRKGLPHPK
jgi:hypothetical protein